MLVIGRREGEEVTIGDAQVTILSIEGSRVKLGIVAPHTVHVSRPDAKRKTKRVSPSEDDRRSH